MNLFRDHDILGGCGKIDAQVLKWEPFSSKKTFITHVNSKRLLAAIDYCSKRYLVLTSSLAIVLRALLSTMTPRYRTIPPTIFDS